ncbi:hypothetical protein SAMN05661096_01486 [Marivirga sericea]|uniref:Class IIb bacteriocin, lactobin A/cerein 7B family n=1 Tax=Marivirga sericea TaxID=1028 RepID=A0A1X7JAM4_9BACT|nr:hypothetical protein [Marivirga sericea]SMG24753.1 hypothetical protein SAMN05661096_01486 [Marivirga sericea]
MENLSFEELNETNGGSIAGLVAAGITIVGAAIYVYNNAADMAQGFEDGVNGNYNPPSDCN